MAAATKALQKTFRDVGLSVRQRYRIANGRIIYFHTFVGLAGANYGVTVDRGYAIPLEDATGVQWVGLMVGASEGDFSTENSVVGDTSKSPAPEVDALISPFILTNHDVTGLSAQSDVGKPVYALNDNELTLTAGVINPVGRLEFWRSGTKGDILIYGRLPWLVI